MFDSEKRKKIITYLSGGFLGLLFVMIFFSFSKKGVYFQKLGINLVVAGSDGISLALVRPNEEQLTWIKLPLAMSVKIDNSNAVYPIYSLWKYASGEKNSLEVVTKSLETTLGVTLPAIIKIDDKVSPENVLTALKAFGLKTNLTVRDRILLNKDLSVLVSGRKVLEVDIPKTALTTRADPDGVEFLEVNNVINLWTKNRFVFESLLGENVNVSVYNLSGVDGRGLSFSRKLESAGVRVVKVASKYESHEKKGVGCVFSNISNHPDTVYLISNFLGCKMEKGSATAGPIDEIQIWLF